MKTAFFVLACSVSLFLGACREESGSSPVLSYNGKPIDPICFNALGETTTADSIDLQSCTGTVGQDGYVSEKGLETYGDGSIGYEFKCVSEGCPRNPSISYKYLGKVKDQHAVLTRQSSGGSGLFSFIGLYDLRDGVLTRIRGIAGGDRCNAGVSDAGVGADGKLRYSQNITPIDMANISQGNKAGFKAYKDIQACASCCIGVMNFADDMVDSVTLTKNPSEIVPEDLGPVDTCFFGTYNEYFKAGNTRLDRDAIKAFGETFHQRCGQLQPARESADDGRGPMTSAPAVTTAPATQAVPAPAAPATEPAN